MGAAIFPVLKRADGRGLGGSRRGGLRVQRLRGCWKGCRLPRRGVRRFRGPCDCLYLQTEGCREPAGARVSGPDSSCLTARSACWSLEPQAAVTWPPSMLLTGSLLAVKQQGRPRVPAPQTLACPLHGLENPPRSQDVQWWPGRCVGARLQWVGGTGPRKGSASGIRGPDVPSATHRSTALHGPALVAPPGRSDSKQQLGCFLQGAGWVTVRALVATGPRPGRAPGQQPCLERHNQETACWGRPWTPAQAAGRSALPGLNVWSLEGGRLSTAGPQLGRTPASRGGLAPSGKAPRAPWCPGSGSEGPPAAPPGVPAGA